MQHRMGRVAHQVASVDERYDLDPRRKYALIEFLHFGVESFERSFRICAFPHRYPRRNHVIIIDYGAILAMNGPSELAQTDLRSLSNRGNISDPQRRSVLGHDDRIFDVVY